MDRFEILKGIIPIPPLPPKIEPDLQRFTNTPKACCICNKPLAGTGFVLQGNLGVLEKGIFGGLYGSNHLCEHLKKQEATPSSEIHQYAFHGLCLSATLIEITQNLR